MLVKYLSLMLKGNVKRIIGTNYKYYICININIINECYILNNREYVEDNIEINKANNSTYDTDG